MRDILTDTSIRNRYHRYYYTLIEDYFSETDNCKSTSLGNLYTNMMKKLAYYLLHPQYYNHSFYHYSIPWMFNLQMFMRAYILDRKSCRGEIPHILNRSNPATHGYYPLPKPLNNDNMNKIANKLYDIMYKDTTLYIKLLRKHGHIS